MEMSWCSTVSVSDGVSVVSDMAGLPGCMAVGTILPSKAQQCAAMQGGVTTQRKCLPPSDTCIPLLAFHLSKRLLSDS